MIHCHDDTKDFEIHYHRWIVLFLSTLTLEKIVKAHLRNSFVTQFDPKKSKKPICVPAFVSFVSLQHMLVTHAANFVRTTICFKP